MEELKRFRVQQGKSREEMAAVLGISKSLYEKIELGHKTVSANFVRRFKKTFPSFDVNIFFTH